MDMVKPKKPPTEAEGLLDVTRDFEIRVQGITGP
jgi:hypothetical protein